MCSHFLYGSTTVLGRKCGNIWDTKGSNDKLQFILCFHFEVSQSNAPIAIQAKAMAKNQVASLPFKRLVAPMKTKVEGINNSRDRQTMVTFFII